MNLHAAGLLPVEALQSGRFRLDTINAGFDALSDGQPGRQLLVFDERR